VVAGAVFVPPALSDGAVVVRDARGDVKGGPGPDIVAASAREHAGRISFHAVFTTSPPLIVSTKQGFTDMLLVSIWTSDRVTRRPDYWLGVHAVDLERVVLVNAQTRKMISLRPAVVSRRSVTLTVAEYKIGNPSVIRFSVAAGRETNAESGGGGDLAPDHGASMPFAL
jgi:hypothetical protein